MFKSKSVLFVLSLCVALLATGSSTLQAAEIKVGYVNFGKVLEQAPQRQEASSRLETEFAPRDRNLNNMRIKLTKLEDLLVKNGAVMSATERERKQGEIRKLRRDIRATTTEFREDYNLARGREQTKLQRLVVKVIKDMGKAEKFDLIIGDAVIYAGDKVNITEKVLAKLKSLK